MNKCEKCGFLHYRTDPCRVAKKSTASRKDEDSKRSDMVSEGRGKAGAQVAPIVHVAKPAGTQALPVDTPKRGRPSTGFDKRAYNKQYMADRRAGKR